MTVRNVISAFLLLLMLPLSSVASGSFTASWAPTSTVSVSYSGAAPSMTMTVLINSTGGFDPGWYGGNYVGNLEWSIWRGGYVIPTTGGISFGGSIGASATASSVSRTFAVTPGDVITVIRTARHAGNGSAGGTITDSYTVPAAAMLATVALKNERDVPVTFRAMQNGVMIGEVTLQPGQALVQQFNAPTTGPVQVYERVPNLAKDGDSWVLVEGAVTEKPVGNPVTPHAPDSPPATPPAIPQSPDIPKVVSPTPKPADAPVWSPSPAPSGTSDLLSGQLFQAGIDKVVVGQAGLATAISNASLAAASRDTVRDGKLDSILAELQAEGPPAASYTDPTKGSAPLTLGDPITKAVAKLPTAPTLSSLSSASSISIFIPVPTLTGGTITYEKTIDFAAAPYATPIALFRGAMWVVLTLSFFVLSFYTVRSAFAGK